MVHHLSRYKGIVVTFQTVWFVLLFPGEGNLFIEGKGNMCPPLLTVILLIFDFFVCMIFIMNFVGMCFQVRKQVSPHFGQYYAVTCA